MKTKNSGAAAKVKAKTPAKSPDFMDKNVAAVLFTGGSRSLPDREFGPDCFFTPQMNYHVVMNGAMHHAAGTKKEGLNLFEADESKRVLVVSNFGSDDAWQMRSCIHDSISKDFHLDFNQLAKARKNMKWCSTDLRGAELLAYVGNMVDAFNPGLVVIWPLGYLIGAPSPQLGRRLINESRWFAKGTVYQVKPPVPDSRNNKDDDDFEAADWWKR